MADLKFDIDIDGIVKEFNSFKNIMAQDLEKEVEGLAIMTHAKLHELAGEKLKSLSKLYRDNIAFSNPAPNMWVVTLKDKAVWIDDGKKQGSIIDDLLRNGAKTAADGCVLNPRNKVLTVNGWVKIKDIKIGDLVLAHSGKFREVKDILIQKAGIGTEYVNFYTQVDNSTNEPLSSRNTLCAPSISLTLDHLVLTPNGWIPAKDLKKGDLVASPADLTRKCDFCKKSLPINSFKLKYCINNSCARKASCRDNKNGLMHLTEGQRQLGNTLSMITKTKKGMFDDPNYGARNPEVLKKLRKASIAKQKEFSSTNCWYPETFFERKLQENNIEFEREVSIKTDRVVKAPYGQTKLSTMFFDFYFPNLKLAVELDGKYWHSQPEAIERDLWKNKAAQRDGITLWRIPSHEIYNRYSELIDKIILWSKNHSGQLGICWSKITKIKKGIVDRVDHVYANKYDLCLSDDEHSFCCQNIFIHNSKYRVIPFVHSKNPSEQAPKAQVLAQQIKSELKKQGINWKKVEYGADGSPRTGLVQRIDIESARPSPKAKTDALKGVAIYQTKQANGSVRRDVLTFRVVSEKQKAEGMWVHPGREGDHLMDEVFQWAQKTWEEDILPAVVNKYK
jgi:intein/homing endonuclease